MRDCAMSGKILTSTFFLWIAFAGFFLAKTQTVTQEYSRTVILMGSSFSFTAVSEDSTIAYAAMDSGIAEVHRIEQLISSWNPGSETSNINRNAGIQPVVVNQELLQLIQRSKKVSALTQGAFDITFSAAGPLYLFDGKEHELPDSAQVAASVSHIDYMKIETDAEALTVFLPKAEMKIGFGAIGKGYAANRAREKMKQAGISSGIVNAGGDLISWGAAPGATAWEVAIINPVKNNEIFGWLQVNNMAVVTSGNYEKYFTCNGLRYSHIIDPRNGYPAKDIASVTVVCADAELADALATAVFVLGKKGIELINQLNGIECLVIDEAGKTYTSENLQLHFYQKKDKQ
ncbi:MAG: FAD:protein FMN transferase [Bacteroidia bacterium]